MSQALMLQRPPRRRGCCRVCGVGYLVRADGRIRRHQAHMWCNSYEEQHDHMACIRQYGSMIVPLLQDGSAPDCPGSLQPPAGSLWVVMMRRAVGGLVHFGYPDRAPITTVSIFWAACRDAIVARHFPVEAAEEWAGEPVRWFFACHPGTSWGSTDLLGALRCEQSRLGSSLGMVSCLPCRRWEHETQVVPPSGG